MIKTIENDVEQKMERPVTMKNMSLFEEIPE